MNPPPRLDRRLFIRWMAAAAVGGVAVARGWQPWRALVATEASTEARLPALFAHSESAAAVGHWYLDQFGARSAG
jgi:hypothetical protein